MSPTKRVAAIAATVLIAVTSVVVSVGPASAAGRDGSCDEGEFCYFFNSGQAGSVSDFAESIADYGATQPECYEFKGAGNGKGKCVKNNAASVWNRTGKSVTVFFNSNYGGTSQSIGSGNKANLIAALKNNNASHRIGGSGSTSGFRLPFPCGETWVASTRSGHSPANAVDFNHYPVDAGWKVYASAPGTVSKVANLGTTSYGRYIVIDHPGGWQTYYAHLSSQEVSVGQTVTEKTWIGRVGSTGGSTGPHLHYEQRQGGTVRQVTFVDGSPAYPDAQRNLARTSRCPS